MNEPFTDAIGRWSQALERWPSRRRAAGLLLGILVLVGLATWLRWLLTPWLDGVAPFALCYLVVAFVGLLAGLGPSLLAAVLGGVGIWLLLQSELIAGLLQLTVYGLTSGVVAILANWARHHRRQAATQAAAQQNRAAALQESEQRLRLFVQRAPVAIAMLDRQLRYVAVSERWKQDLGMVESLIGRSHLEVFPEVPMGWKQIQHRTLAGENLGADEDRVLDPESPLQYLKWETRPWYDPQGQIGGMLIAAEEVSARVAARQALQRSELLNRRILQSLPANIAVLDEQGRIQQVNEAWTEFGQANSDGHPVVALGANYLEVCRRSAQRGEPDAETALAGIAAVLEHRARQFSMEYACHSPQQRRWFLMKVVALEYDCGGALITHLEITEQKLAEQALRQSEEQFRLVADNIPQLAWMIQADGHMIWFNQRWSEFTGTSLATMREQGWGCVHHPEHFARVWTKWSAALRSGQPWEDTFPLRGQDGQYRWFLSRAFPIHDAQGAIRYWFGTNTDITAQKQAETSLRQSEEKFRAVFEQSAIGMGLVGFADTRWIEVNQALCRMLGYRAAELQASPWGQITPPAERDLDLSPWRRLATGQLDSYTLEKRLLHKDGHHIWGRLTVSLVRDARGQPDHGIAIIENITEQHRAMEALRDSEQRLRWSLQAAQGGAWDWDLLRQQAFWSPEMYQLCGLSPQQAISTEELVRMIEPPDRLRVQQALDRAIEGRTDFVLEFRLRHPQRGLLWMVSHGRLVFDNQGRAIRLFGITQDITDRKVTEEKLRQWTTTLERRVAERTTELTASNRELEALTYTVAHDLRAPLRHILSFVELLRTRALPQLDPESVSLLQRTCEAAARMQRLIDGLLEFSRLGRAELVCQPVPLNPLVEEVRQLLGPEEAGRTVQWHIGDLPMVAGDARMLREVFYHLLHNALKFTRERAVAIIEVECRPDPDFELIDVRDNGVGFQMQYAGKLFGVFQRLHDRTQFEGTGIGLAHVQRIVQRHGGRVWAESRPEQGTTIHLALPKRQAQAQAA